MQNKIYIVDDDTNISELLKLYFEKENYKVNTFDTGRKAIEAIDKFAPDIILLDIMMPDMDGFDVLREVRKTSKIPVIMLTAKGDTFDKVLGLELGADDYVVKPFEPKELLARVKAVIRRIGDKSNDDLVTIPNLTVDQAQYTVIYHDKVLQLPPKEFELLNFLIKHPNRVFTREQLLEQIWSFDYFGDTRTVDVHIKRLREKFTEKDPWEIKTVWGVGYKFVK